MNMMRYYPWNVFNPLNYEVARVLDTHPRKVVKDDSAADGDWAPAVRTRVMDQQGAWTKHRNSSQ